MKKVTIVSDFFYPEVVGGAEKYNEELIKSLQGKGYEIETRKCVLLQPTDISTDTFYIVANFMQLNENVKKLLIQNKNYLILEHDHKYVKSNNPTLYSNMVVPEDQLQNKEFYKAAKVVFCQSKMHSNTLQKNLLLSNVVNLSCNIWSDSDLALLRTNLGKQKTRKFGVLESHNKNKGMPQAIEYCRRNNINFEMIPFSMIDDFYKELARTESLVFFPQWMETFCRVAIEARILGCKLVTNKVVGCTSEPYFALKGEELLDCIEAKKLQVIQNYVDVLEGNLLDFEPLIPVPKVSVITTIYKAGEYIKGFVDSFLEQTIATESELIIVDANSPDNEMEVVSEYMETHPNIKYVRLNEKLTPMDCFNIATKKYVEGEYIACVLVDDRMANDHLEVLSKHLYLDPSVDLVYGDCMQTTKPNETAEKNSSKGRLYEHSRMEFSRENMIKCLPGPMPMYRKSMHEKNGLWNEKLKHAGDWELWLRCVRGGSIFKKINKPLGLYYYNPNGLSTSPEHMLPRRKEERDVFNDYKDVIGEKNYNLFKEYFNSVE